MRGDQLRAVPFGTGCQRQIRKVSVCTGEESVAGARCSTHTVTVVMVASAVLALAVGCGFEIADFVVGSEEMRGDCGRHDQAEVLVEVALRAHDFVGASV